MTFAVKFDDICGHNLNFFARVTLLEGMTFVVTTGGGRIFHKFQLSTFGENPSAFNFNMQLFL